MVKTKRLLIKLLSTALACLFVLSGIAFPVFAEETSPERGDLGDRLSAINIALNGQVSLLFYFTSIENVAYYSVEYPNQAGITTTTQFPISQLKYDSAKDRYCLEVSVAAAQQTDNIKVQSVDANGNGGKVRSYSVRDYADKVFELAEKDPDRYLIVCEALKSMLNYGAMAQLAFGYNTENLANEGLYADGTNPVYGMTLADMMNVPDYASTIKSTADSFYFSSATAVLTGKAALKLYVAYNGDYSNLSLTVSGGSNRTDGRDEYVADTLYQEGSTYCAVINNIPATRYNNLYAVKLTDGTNTLEGSFSMLNYVQILYGSGLANAACAMYQYYVWITAYVNSAKLGTTDIEEATAGLVKTDCNHSRTYVTLVGVPGRTCSDCGHFFAGYRLLDENDEKYPEYAIEGYWGDRTSYYNATGYDSVSLAGLNFGSSLQITDLYNENETDSSFNRFSLSYYAAQPTKITVNYTSDGSAKETYYYLEKGEHTFCAVLPDFATGSSIDSIVVTACESERESSTFVLFDYALETITVPSTSISLTSGSQTLTIGRDTGFAITALKHSGVTLVSDFISDNQYSWQSGTLRIIDVQVSSTEVYGKVQHGETYYEITYTANGDSIISTNTITDYSGADNGFATYSLPSLYVPSSLTDFSYYDGISNWTNGTLTSATSTSDTYNLRYSAEESWIALNYGTNAAIGIYLPSVDSVEIGTSGSYRYAYMQKTFRLVPYETTEYSYLIATNTTVANVRSTFLANKNFTENEDLNKDCVSTRIPDEEPDMTNLSFAHEQMSLLLRDATNSVVRYHSGSAAALVEATDSAPSVYLDFTLYDHVSGYTAYSAKDYVQIRIKYMIPEGNGNKTCTVYLNELTALGTVTLTADGTYRTEVIDISSITSGSSATIDSLKLVFDDAAAGDAIYIRGVQLLTEEDRIAGAEFIPKVDMTDILTVGTDGAGAANTTMTYDETEGAIKLTALNDDPFVTANYSGNGLSLNVADYNTIQFTFMIPSANSREAYHFDLFLILTDANGNATAKSIRCSVITADDLYHTVIVPIPSDLSGTISSVRLDYLDSSATNDVMYLYSMIVSANTLEDELTNVDFTKKGSAGTVFSIENTAFDWGTTFNYSYQLTALVPASGMSQTGVEFDESVGAIKLTASQLDPSVDASQFDPFVAFWFGGSGLLTQNYSGVKIKYKVADDCSPNQRVQLFTYTSNMSGYDGLASVTKTIEVDGEFHILEVDLSALSSTNSAFWSGEINVVRLDFFYTYYAGESNTMYITAIELIPAQ